MHSYLLRTMMLGVFVVGLFAAMVPGAVIRAKLSLNPHVPAAAIPAKLRIFIRGQHTSTGDILPDSGHRFSFDFPFNNDSSADVFCVAPGLDTLFLRTISRNLSGQAEISLLFPAEPDTTKAGDIICPRCRKDDQVYPVSYGEPIVLHRHFDSAGKISYEQIPGNGTEPDEQIRVARFYCRRDKITF